MYLGYPKTDDPIYSLWEPSRLKLKELYGASPERDFWTDPPSKSVREQIKQQVNGGEFNFQDLNISMLEVLWVTLECGELHYYNRVLDKPNSSAYYRKDVRYYQKVLHPADPNIVPLEKGHIPMIAVLLIQDHNVFDINNPRWNAVFGDHETAKKIEAMKWFVTTLVTYWIKKQEIWGYISREGDNRLEAVVFWEPPENHEASLGWLMKKDRLKGTFKIGPMAYGHLVDKFKEAKELRHKHADKHAGVIHYLSINNQLPEDRANTAMAELLKSIVEYQSDPTYAVVYQDEQAIKYLKDVGMTPVPDVSKEGLTLMYRETPGKYAVEPATNY
jgi:hypothetical protein